MLVIEEKRNSTIIREDNLSLKLFNEGVKNTLFCRISLQFKAITIQLRITADPQFVLGNLTSIDSPIIHLKKTSEDTFSLYYKIENSNHAYSSESNAQNRRFTVKSDQILANVRIKIDHYTELKMKEYKTSSYDWFITHPFLGGGFNPR